MKNIATKWVSTNIILRYFCMLVLLFTGCVAARMPDIHDRKLGGKFDLAIFLPDEKRPELLHIFSKTGVVLSMPQDGSGLFEHDQKGIIHVRIQLQGELMLRALFRNLSEADIIVQQCIPQP
ncbi:hypothetical protein [Pedobacter miscanthi]|nr:hypothetical protein [Pedobacter miscanthi]